MKLTEVQIERLYRFTREHFVEHYDVQSELVDHLANDIESIMEASPSLTFDEALRTSFKKFGVFGFQEVIASKSKAMEKKYWKLVFHILKDFFTIPRIALSFTLFVGILIAFQIFGFRTTFLAIGISGASVMIIKAIQVKRLQKKRFEESGRKWLLEEFVLNMGSMAVLVNLFFQLAIYSPSNFSTFIEVFSALILTVFILLVYIVTYVLPNQIEAVLASQYPEYKLV